MIDFDLLSDIIIASTNNISSTVISDIYYPKRKCDRMSCMEKYISNANFEDTGFSYTMSLISGKHKMVILYCLMEYEPVRFNEMKRYLGRITDKTLSTNLKELEADQLVHREEYPQIPPKVEYSLTERGKSLIPILDQMCDWGEQNRL